jgi:putative flavoprotein involved in K+ transport
MLSHKIDTVVVGGGQAGLSISYYLSQERREHVVLERAPAVANAWRNQRWDSFTLASPSGRTWSPAWQSREGVLPDFPAVSDK